MMMISVRGRQVTCYVSSHHKSGRRGLGRAWLVYSKVRTLGPAGNSSLGTGGGGGDVGD